MNELQIYMIKNIPCFDSREVADFVGKKHKHLIRDIEKYINAISTSPKLSPLEFFMAGTYEDKKGETRPRFWITRKGCDVVAHKLTGVKGIQFTATYVNKFYDMEKQLVERQTLEWQETRKLGKLTRKSETDVIKELVEYAKTQGSRNADMLYMTYSKLANKMAGISSRDLANIKQLNDLESVEGMILHVIRLGMAAGKHYKEIYQDCKRRLEWWQEITFRTPLLA